MMLVDLKSAEDAKQMVLYLQNMFRQIEDDSLFTIESHDTKRVQQAIDTHWDFFKDPAVLIMMTGFRILCKEVDPVYELSSSIAHNPTQIEQVFDNIVPAQRRFLRMIESKSWVQVSPHRRTGLARIQCICDPGDSLLYLEEDERRIGMNGYAMSDKWFYQFMGAPINKF